MRAEWQMKELGRLCDIAIGRTPPRNMPAFWDVNRETSNVWLSIADLANAESGIISDSKEYLSAAGVSRSKIVRAGTLLLSFKLTLGRLAVAGRDLYTNEAIAALTIRDAQQLNQRYLNYFLSFFDWQRATDGDVKLKGRTFNKEKLSSLLVSFPSLGEQGRIVAILDEAFEGIATARANAEKNLQNARALFSQELQLVMAALLGSYPSLKMEEICEIGDGNHSSNYPKKDELVESGVPFIRAQNIVEGSIIGVDMRFLSPEKHAKLKKGHLRAGDVLFTNRGDIGNTAIVSEEYDDSNLNSQIAWFRCTPSMENRFLMYFLNSPAMRELYSSTKSGAALQQFTIKMIKSLQIVCPPRAIQTSTSNRLDSLFTRCRSLEGILNEKLMALDELKQSLLHQAFTGKL